MRVPGAMWCVGATPPKVYLSSSCLGTYRSVGGSAAVAAAAQRSPIEPAVNRIPYLRPTPD